jgi:hypothetical protein
MMYRHRQCGKPYLVNARCGKAVSAHNSKMRHQNETLYFRCSSIPRLAMESLFQITETAIRWLKVQLEKLKYEASSAKSGSVRL